MLILCLKDRYKEFRILGEKKMEILVDKTENLE